MKFLKTIMAATVAAVTLFATSCNNDDNTIPAGKSYIDFVTVRSASSNGAVFTFRKENDSPLVTLTTGQSFAQSGIKEGERIVINYAPESGEQYASGPVTVYQAVATEGKGGAPAEKTASETRNWASDRVSMALVQRSGEYINLIFRASTMGDPKECAVYVDAETIGTETPHLHLIFEAANAAMGNEYYFYSSYSIAELWNAPTTKSVRIYYADMLLPQNYTEFVKANADDNERPEL